MRITKCSFLQKKLINQNLEKYDESKFKEMPLKIPYCPSILCVSKIINNSLLYPFCTTTSSSNIVQNLVCIFCFHFFEKTLAYHMVQAISKQQIILRSFFMFFGILLKNRFWCFVLPFEMVSIIFCLNDIFN